ncbi:MAG: AbgT family transporter [bacterium]|nr:AbgT family transporter [bacterium]
MTDPAPLPETSRQGGFLNAIEALGNRLPDPATLFLIGTLLVMVLSHLAVKLDWRVDAQLPTPVTETRVDAATGEETQVPVLDEDGRPMLEWQPTGDTFFPKSLLEADGLFWALNSMVNNFMGFAPLGVVLVGMLGIGIAERVGLIAALLKAFMMVVPGRLLTPAMIFLGVMSSMGIDAGYVVLPPLAAALYKAVGRSPLAGLAAVFAGVAAGFNANLFVTGLDPMLAGFATTGAQVIDPDYAVNPACNWWFMIASTFLITATGWFVTAAFVEKRLATKSPEDGGPVPPSEDAMVEQRLRPDEVKGLTAALGVFFLVLGVFLASIFKPGWFLHGAGPVFDRWAHAIVPMLFFLFILPAIAYGARLGQIHGDKVVAKHLIDSIAAMAPIIVLAFFAAQFIEHFKYSGLDKMLALAGGQMLGKAQLPTASLVVAFIGVTFVFNLFIGSMSAKYAMFAPIFIPMFMLVGISPELTQAAYRIGDSVSNSITPLNPYLIIILVFMQKFVPRAGMGTLISTMLPYSIAFAIVWTIMLVGWMVLGWPLGPDGGLSYTLPGQ